MHDFIRDWRRWSPAERLAAVALVGLALALVFVLLIVSRGAS
jgi:hypothetical protein